MKTNMLQSSWGHTDCRYVDRPVDVQYPERRVEEERRKFRYTAHLPERRHNAQRRTSVFKRRD